MLRKSANALDDFLPQLLLHLYLGLEDRISYTKETISKDVPLCNTANFVQAVL